MHSRPQRCHSCRIAPGECHARPWSAYDGAMRRPRPASRVRGGAGDFSNRLVRRAASYRAGDCVCHAHRLPFLTLSFLSAATAMVAIALPYAPFAGRFVPLHWQIMTGLRLITATYLLVFELTKQWFVRWDRVHGKVPKKGSQSGRARFDAADVSIE